MYFAVIGLLVVFVIGFFVVVWKAAPHWRWYQIVAAVFTLLLAITFLFPTAMVLKSRAAWHQAKEKIDQRFTQVRDEQHRLKYGDLSNPDSAGGIIQLNRELARMGMKSGRRWRGLQKQNVTDENITLTVPTDPASGVGQPDGGTAAPPVDVPLVPTDLVVYGFAETPNQQQQSVPTLYLGEYVVTASTPTSVTIEPTAPLEPIQVEAISGGQSATWSLYELLPLDGHAMFVAEGSIPSDENFLGRVNEELISKLLGDKIPQETLESYLRDGSRSQQSDPPYSRWTKIEFLQPSSFDVDATEQRSVLDGGYFDGIGRAVDPRLQKGDAVTFEKGDQIVIKEEKANELIEEGTARLVDQYYLRPLNDYRYILRQIRMQLTELASRMETLNFEQEVLQSAADKTQQLLVEKQQVRLKLEQDLAHFRTEAEAIEKYAQTVRERAEAMRTEMKRLHQQNLVLEQQLRIQHGVTRPGVAGF